MEKVGDRRVACLLEYVITLTELKEEKIVKNMDSNPNFKDEMIEFLESAEHRMMFIIVTPATMEVLLSPPKSFRGKLVFYFKKVRGSLPEDVDLYDMQTALLIADLPSALFKAFTIYLGKIFAPVMIFDKNLEAWPTSLRSCIKADIHQLRKRTEQVDAKLEGKMLLAVPMGLRNIETYDNPRHARGEDVSGSVMYSIETTVVDWTSQIYSILKEDSGDPIIGGSHPTPFFEHEYWIKRTKLLQDIYDQLATSEAKKMANLLEYHESAYYGPFKCMFRRVVRALVEAQSFSMYLKPLVDQATKFEMAEYEECKNYMEPIMHVLGLIWINCPFLRKSDRLIVILTEIANLYMEKARSHLDPDSLLKDDPADVLIKVNITMNLINHHKYLLSAYRENVKESCLRQEVTPAEWSFADKLVCARLDAFENRLKKVKFLLETVMEYNRLEKIEISGINGPRLSAQVVVVFDDFNNLFKHLTEKHFDCLNPDETTFDEEYDHFMAKIQDFDLRLSTIISRAFDFSTNVLAIFRLMYMFSGMLERPCLQAHFSTKIPILLDKLHHEMDVCKLIYDRQMARGENAEIPKNMAPSTGRMFWVNSLKRRAGSLVQPLKMMKHAELESEYGQLLHRKHEELIELLDGYYKISIEEFCKHVDEMCSTNLSRPLLERDEAKNTISVNFDLKLHQVLKETQYLLVLSVDKIPDSATKLYEMNEKLRKYRLTLGQIVHMYNFLREHTNAYEYPLISGKMSTIDEGLKAGESKISWETDCDTYITEQYEQLKDLYERVVNAQTNLDTVTNILNVYKTKPLYSRKEKKHDSTLNLEERDTIKENRFNEVAVLGDQIVKLIEENKNYLEVTDETDNDWENYLEYVEEILLEVLTAVTQCSLQYLEKQTEFVSADNPLISATLQLEGEELLFCPEMDASADDNLADLFESIMNDIAFQANFIPRVAIHIGDDSYTEELNFIDEINQVKLSIGTRVRRTMEAADEYRVALDEPYNMLWVDDRKEFMKQFVMYGRTLQPEDFNDRGELEGVEECRPSLDKFREEIEKYEGLYAEVERLKDREVFNGWLLVDSRPLKHQLLDIITQWGNEFKLWLLNHVMDSLNELNEFIDASNEQLKGKIKDEYAEIVLVLNRLKSVRSRQEDTDAMFEPINDTIQLLKDYGKEPPESTNLQLEKLPEMWQKLKNLAIVKKQKIQPLQEREVNNINKNCKDLEDDVKKAKMDFMRSPLFKYACENPYYELNKWNNTVSKMEEKVQQLQEAAQIFDVCDLPPFADLRVIRRDMRYLKTLWDYVFLFRYQLEGWKTSRWQEIDFNSTEDIIREITTDLRGTDKEVKKWPVFLALEASLKETTTALAAVKDLQDPAIKDRHWCQLMEATGVKLEVNDNTTLSELLTINLHKFEDEVRTIVSKACTELKIDSDLTKLASVWETLVFTYEEHGRTGITLLRATEDVSTTLEESQTKIQDMLGNRDNAFFIDSINYWHRNLSTVENVMSLWFEIQRVWINLETIFVLCDDIREMLPDDTEAFFGVENDFKQVLSELCETPSVLATCTAKQNRGKQLIDIRERLARCEKALSEYLETKRLSFPRFYFVSVVDLMDIVSNGRFPERVIKHLSKLFDSINDLKFENPNETPKTVNTMIAKDGEIVKLTKQFKLEGQVEEWLNNLLSEMRNTVRMQLMDAVSTYEEKPRDQWIFDYPAQVALTGSQIGWTTEVNMAFARLEEGLENAMKDFNKKQVTQLGALITMLIGKLSKDERQKVMTLCTIDVHNRDVVMKLIAQQIYNAQAFAWLSQLRHRWDETNCHCYANICDAEFLYTYEYLGNQPRLVITPLTDRCYTTLTQSLHLCMSGAPAGPAGTGKTETTKDLGRALGMMVYVFNCSEQMDYRSVGNIYKGLAQSGAWGCFDEFNRIAIEVLSVVAVQVKSIQDAIKLKKSRFDFLGEEISLERSVGLFITMNPGYAGRTELPENLKALFRPCAMVVPDFELICEIMLVAEGFLNARLLARKFITLYELCKELLSKQHHYDWGLRAIKSVLVVAGSLKRADPSRQENEVLMRALRDFNTPKIVTDDLPVFMGLIGDLFPAMNVPRKRDPQFEASVKEATESLGLQPEDSFILKVVQLQELFAVRHSVFIVGNPGTGKSQVWKTLQETYKRAQNNPVAIDLNPKSVTNDELFGIINPTNREWKDGLFSVIMRDLSQMEGDGWKWIVLDGDIDPMWIESLNTVMDDNKILTLASNERIALTPSMRLLFEISHLKTATPATVSRAGILYVNPQDLGWSPYVFSWLDGRIRSKTSLGRIERPSLTNCFDKYVPPCLDVINKKFKKITPIPDICHIQVLCHLLDFLLKPANISQREVTKETFELFFVFCCVWAFGSCLFKDQLHDYRQEFSKWWVNEFKVVKFPSSGQVFDFVLNPKTKKFDSWKQKVTKFELDSEMPLLATLVPTTDVACMFFFLDMLILAGIPVMLVGAAGTGKSVILQTKFDMLTENFLIKKCPFNFYTTSAMLQEVLEKPLEKKAGRNYGPPGQRHLIYFIDDINMPEVDQYFTVQPHTLMRQHIDYNHWYDREKMTLKVVHNTQYVAAMNPKAGSFSINGRLQRHFAVFALSFPSDEAVQSIYKAILGQHCQQNNFGLPLVRFAESVIDCALQLHNRIANSFLPTAIKFHYVFNLRDLANIFQGMLFASPETVKKSNLGMLRLYIHEAERTYCDKLVDEEDIVNYKKSVQGTITQLFQDMNAEELFAQPSEFFHYLEAEEGASYLPLPSFAVTLTVLEQLLSNYNDTYAAMNLVLFSDAVKHVLKICRIMEMPRGNALLVGIGGSGKQSLSRLAAFICNLHVSQIVLRKGYSKSDFKDDIAKLYLKSAVKNVPTAFILTDAQIADEHFLVCVNDLLASGEISGLFTDEEVEPIIQAMRNECKQAGIIDSNENCWKFFINKVRRNLKVVLCFSPVGATLRVRARRFPALVNCTCIDWFHEWPQEALLSVSARFLNDVSLLSDSMRTSVSTFLAFAQTTVNEVSAIYHTNDRRFNYTTPKSFLEQIALYKNLLFTKNEELNGMINRLENGLERLKEAGEQTEELKVQLAEQEIVVNEKTENTDILIEKVGQETEKVSAEKDYVAEEEKKVAVIKKEVERKQRECERDLAKAEPALLAAQEALNTLNKANLTELKALASPPVDVVSVVSAVMCLMALPGKVPRDLSWKAAKAGVLSRVDALLNNLINYDKEHIPDTSLAAVKQFTKKASFNPEVIKTKSIAASGLCSWVVNILIFYDVYCNVQPKRDALAAANEALKAASDKLDSLRRQIAHLEASLNTLTEEFKAATEEKLRCQEMAEFTAKTLDLANRLVNGFASEKVRWAQEVKELKKLGATLTGDVLLTASVISYTGYFTKKYRNELTENKWKPLMKSLPEPILLRENFDPIAMLIDDAVIASWNNNDLPEDKMSVENATILSFCERWPIMVDPQLQGIKWIKSQYSQDLVVIRLDQKGYLDRVCRAIEDGKVVLIENIFEELDPVLDPVLGRNTTKKGRYMNISDKEIPYNKSFRLIMQTKLANPHYKPEIQAQCTLINFSVTRDGLEDQLLAVVVSKERPDLEHLKKDLTRQQNEFKITLKTLEDSLLARLSSSGGNFLGDHALVENLETNKATATEIAEQVAKAKVTEAEIDVARNDYRAVATRAALLYFIMNDMYKINPMYQFSLKALRIVFEYAIDISEQVVPEEGEALEPKELVERRLANLTDSITYCIFVYTTRGLFEKDKMVFTMLMTLQILLIKEEITQAEIDFLLRYPVVAENKSPLDFLSDLSWGGVQMLVKMENFRDLDKDMMSSAKRWKTFVESESPETEKYPQEWKNKSNMVKLCIMRSLRPDRMTYAVTHFVTLSMGTKYTEGKQVEFAKSFSESSPSAPIFFILSPGVDPLKDVELLGQKMGYTGDNHNFYNVSLGQGQEVVAEQALEKGSECGHWVILQNVHLVAKWLPVLEKEMEKYSEQSHENFRVFISAEPAATADAHIIPQGLLENSVKITNEPPTGMHANLHKALYNFDQQTLERCTKEAEFKPIVFALCYFHAVVTERRKFGAQGWNRVYPFNNGDLTICVDVLYNYLEANTKVPWEDLRYLFGEIMYGGHITDDWDRRLCRSYLEEYMQPELLDGDLAIAPGFLAPGNTDYIGYHKYIDECLPPETPYLYGMHPNAEIEFLTSSSERLFRVVLEMQPRDTGAAEGGGQSRDEMLGACIDDLLERLPDNFSMLELQGRQTPEERTPYTVVVLQECERMNTLTSMIRTSLRELVLGLKGELTISAEMESLGNSIFLDNVPDVWERHAYPSLFPLGMWFSDLLQRIKELEAWTQDFSLPGSVWLGGLFNPQSFLTAVMQQMARKNEWPLDRMTINVDVTKKTREEMGSAPREGAYIHGLYMEGARWDPNSGCIAEARLKELAPLMNVIFLKAIPVDRQELRNTYACPVYKTKVRGPTFVWTFNLKTKEKPSKWILGSVALLLSV